MSVYQIQPSFAGGELAPTLWGRVDLAKYSTGLKCCENFIVQPQGGVTRRPGMEYITQAKDSCRLVPFVYNTSDAYVLEFSAECIRFFKNGSPVLKSNGDPYEVTVPYTYDSLSALKFTQSADTMFIVHRSYPPAKLVRYSDTNWKWEKLVIDNGPFREQTSDEANIKLQASAIDGDVTITSSDDLFSASNVGQLIEMTQQVDEVHNKVTSSGTWDSYATVYDSWRLSTNGFWYGTITLQRYDENEGRWVSIKTYTSVNSSTASKNYSDSGDVDEPTRMRITSTDFTPFVPEDNEDADAGYVEFFSEATEHSGIARITSVANARNVSATVLNPLASTNATDLWRFGSWNAEWGYPSAVGFFQDRMCFGGSKKEPQTVWMSKTGDYYNFGTTHPSASDDAITATVVSRQVNSIEHFINLERLVVLTGGSEWTISADGAVTPSNINARAQGYRGTDEIEPVVVGNMVLFIQQHARRVRDLGYDYSSDSYTGNDLSVMAAHLTEDYAITDCAYTQEPYSILWAVRSDGALLGLTYLREHQVVAWGRHPTDGTVKSVASVPGENGDDLYLYVVRNGKNCIEIMHPWRDVETATDGIYLDSAVSITSSAGTNSITGLSHLAGKTVQVMGDGSYLGEYTVSDSGTVTLTNSFNVLRAGLGYQSKIRTLDINAQRQDGTQTTRKSRVVSLKIRVDKTRGLWAGVDEDHLEENIDRTSEAYNDPTSLLTADLQLFLDSGYESYGGGSVWVETKYPLPASIQAIVPEVSLGG